MISKIEQAYRMLSSLSVSGDAVDIVAGIRSLLRDAMKEADRNGKQTDKPAAGGSNGR